MTDIQPTKTLDAGALKAAAKAAGDAHEECLRRLGYGGARVNISVTNHRILSAAITAYIAALPAQAEPVAWRDALEAIEDLLTAEISARFSHPYLSEEESARSSTLFSLLSVPRNIARNALATPPAPPVEAGEVEAELRETIRHLHQGREEARAALAAARLAGAEEIRDAIMEQGLMSNDIWVLIRARVVAHKAAAEGRGDGEDTKKPGG